MALSEMGVGGQATSPGGKDAPRLVLSPSKQAKASGNAKDRLTLRLRSGQAVGPV